MKHRVVSATEFKAKCSALLDEIEEGGTITVTRRGRAVATLGPAKKKWKSMEGILAGKINITGDIVDTTHLWNALRDDKFNY
jgi:prevent-host-death family protein